MLNYTYNFEISDLVAQFITAFDDVIIKRYNKTKEAQDQIKVNFVYAPKKRALYDIVNKNPNPTNLPVIAVYITSVQRDVNRTENKMAKSYFPISGSIKQRRQPVPINIEMGMTVVAKSTEDLLQIMSNWVPYTDPYIYIDVKDPSTDQIIRTKVRWNEQLSINQELDNPEGKTFRIGFDTSFTIYGYLFKPVEDPAGMICTITTNFHSISSLCGCFTDLAQFEIDIGANNDNSETRIIEGLAKLYCIAPWTDASNKTEDYEYRISGKNLDFVSSLYVSANSGMFPTSAYGYYNYFPDISARINTTPCSENPSFSTEITSANCRPFSAIPITAYSVDSIGANLEFTLPYTPSTSGVFDVIALTPCGCSKLSLNSRSLSTEFYTMPVAQNGGVLIYDL